MNLLPSRSSVTQFCRRHKGKIIATVGVGALLGAAYYFYSADEEENPDDLSKKNRENEENATKSPDRAAIIRRTRQLIAANEIYDFSLLFFLPLIKSKVKEVVDVTETVKRLKELMKNSTNSDQSISKKEMWREIEISSFCSLLMMAYSVSGTSLLLLVQMHLLVRNHDRRSNYNCSSTSKISSEDHSAVFQKLMEHTFGYFFCSGMLNLSHECRKAVEIALDEVGWSAGSTFSINHSDLCDVVTRMRRIIESESKLSIKHLLTNIFSGPNETLSRRDSQNNDVNGLLPSVEVECDADLIDVGQVLDETWKVFFSASFESAFQDTVNATFSFLHRQLWTMCFQHIQSKDLDFPHICVNGHPSPSSPLDLHSTASSPRHFQEATLPLAKLLPKIKSIASILIPEESHEKVGSEVDEASARYTEDHSSHNRDRTLQRIRSLCGADDPQSNSFNLCSLLLDNKLVTAEVSSIVI